MKFQIIDKLKGYYSTEILCKYLGCSKSGYYNWIDLGRPEYRKVNTYKLNLIKQIYEKDKTKGRRRIMMELKRKYNINMSLGSVHHYMKLLNIKSIVKVPKKYNFIKQQQEKSLYTYENVLNRNFKTSSPNSKWVTDITYLISKTGKQFLSTVKDLYDGSIVAYDISNYNDNNLVISTLQKAFETVGYNQLHKLILHSDRGLQYTSKSYNIILNTYGLIGSHSNKGSPLDNASMESFYSTLKSECVRINKRRTKLEMEEIVRKWIETYNNDRPQMKLGGLTPIEYRNKFNCVQK